MIFFFFFFNDTATTEIYTLSLHRRSSDLQLPIGSGQGVRLHGRISFASSAFGGTQAGSPLDRKSTRLNSSHLGISYAVFCLKKKKITSSEFKTSDYKPRALHSYAYKATQL